MGDLVAAAAASGGLLIGPLLRGDLGGDQLAEGGHAGGALPPRPLRAIASQPRFVAAALAGMVAFGTMSFLMSASHYFGTFIRACAG